MSATNDLPDVLDTTTPERVATGFTFTEGPLWHPDDHWYFVDLRVNKLHRLTLGNAPETVRLTEGGNGTTFRSPRPVDCLRRRRPQGHTHRHRWHRGSAGRALQGGALEPPQRCCVPLQWLPLLYRTLSKRRPCHERESPGREGDHNLWDGAAVYRSAPDGSLGVLALANIPMALLSRPMSAPCTWPTPVRRNTYTPSCSTPTATPWVGAFLLPSANARRRTGQSRWPQSRQPRPRVLHGPGRYLGVEPRRYTHRHDPLARTSGQFRLRRS